MIRLKLTLTEKEFDEILKVRRSLIEKTGRQISVTQVITALAEAYNGEPETSELLPATQPLQGNLKYIRKCQLN